MANQRILLRLLRDHVPTQALALAAEATCKPTLGGTGLRRDKLIVPA